MKLTIYALVREKGILVNRNISFDITEEELRKSQEDPHGYFEDLVEQKLATLPPMDIVVTYSAFLVGGL